MRMFDFRVSQTVVLSVLFVFSFPPRNHGFLHNSFKSDTRMKRDTIHSKLLPRIAFPNFTPPLNKFPIHSIISTKKSNTNINESMSWRLFMNDAENIENDQIKTRSIESKDISIPDEADTKSNLSNFSDNVESFTEINSEDLYEYTVPVPPFTAAVILIFSIIFTLAPFFIE